MKQEIEQAITACVLELYAVEITADLTRPDAQFGDFATNIALQLSKQLGKNPREIASELSEKLKSHESIEEISVAGPGFLNIRITDTALLSELLQQPEKMAINQTVVIETNNPNPFKAMHIGHAFNAILADTLANQLEARGAHVYRVSYHGDVGAHVGKSMYALLQFVDGNPEKLQTISEGERNSFMSKMYAEGSRAYKEDEAAKERINELAKQSFTREDPVYAAVYDICKDWSFELLDATVARLGNKPVERRFLESDAEVRGVPIVKKNVPKVFQESDGALIFPGSKYGSFDNAFVGSNGNGLYAARDLGLMQLKNEQYHPQKSYIVTAEEQRAYFKGVIAAAELCMPEFAGVTINISHGTVKLTTGKMSSRSGDVVEIAWLFDQVSDAVTARGGEPTDAVIAGALRYQFLRVRIGGDVVFDVNEAVSLQGNSGPYLQYAHARACSILAKTHSSETAVAGLQADERTLVSKISEYKEVVDRANIELAPHHICNYLYELAQEFNRFYEKNRVIGDEREAIRLGLVAKYRDTLVSGLKLLGIVAPEQM